MAVRWHSLREHLTAKQKSFQLILGFHSRDTGLGNGCYPPSLCPWSVKKAEKRRDANAIV